MSFIRYYESRVTLLRYMQLQNALFFYIMDTQNMRELFKIIIIIIIITILLDEIKEIFNNKKLMNI